MSFITGIRASTSRSTLLLHPIRHVGLQYRHASDSPAPITKATTVQEIEVELKHLQEKEKEAMKKATGQSGIDGGRGGARMQQLAVGSGTDMQQFQTIVLESLTEPKLTLPVILSRLETPIGLTPPYWRWSRTVASVKGRFDWVVEAMKRRFTTMQNLQELEQRGLVITSSRAQIKELSLFNRFFGRILPSRWHLSYLPTVRHALDLYTAYNHAQATRDFDVINKISLRGLRKAARSVAVSAKVEDWGYTETPDVPLIMWSRQVSLFGKTALCQICYQFNTKQYVVIKQKDPKTGAPTITRDRHVVENIVFQCVDPDSAGQGWMLLERVPTTPPLYSLDGAAKEEQMKHVAEHSAALRRLQSGLV